MIKRLRRKLIGMSILSLLLVLLLIMGMVNILNYRTAIKEADRTLSVLAENRGTFPKPDDFKGKALKEHPSMSPELPFESRYYSVVLSDTGQVVSVDTGKIAAVDTFTAAQYAQRVWERNRSRGFMDDYRYISHMENNTTRIIFLDCRRSLSTVRTFLFASCGISFLGLCAVLLLMILLSGRIIRPISESYEKQKQFITDAGHEIKTPISIINADAQVLEMEIGENEWLMDIQNQVKHISSLTNNLIFLSRMEEEQAGICMIDFPFSDLVEDTAQSFMALAKTQKKEFTTAISPMISMCGDEKSLGQLLVILLDNAIKYSPEGGKIILTLNKTGKTARLTVENTIESIETIELDHLFDRFYRGDKSRNSQTGGYGIGLSIAKAVVEAHKGKISASVKTQNWMTITVVLPALLSDLPLSLQRTGQMARNEGPHSSQR